MAQRRTERDEVREILVDIAAEGELARVEARIEEIAEDLARIATEIARADGARRGELEIMRARLDDVFGHIQDTTGEYQTVAKTLSERLERVADDLDERLNRTIAQVRGEAAAGSKRIALLVEQLELRLQGDVEAARERAEELAGAPAGRVEALRRELESGLGEIRATQRLALQGLEEQVGELAVRLDELERREGEERDRWVEALAGTGAAIRETASSIRQALERERSSRGAADRGLAERLDSLSARLDAAEASATSVAGRHEADVARIERRFAELTERVDTVSHQMRGRALDSSEEVQATIAELTQRVERTEAIAREAGRVIVNAVRRARATETPRVMPDPEVQERPLS